MSVSDVRSDGFATMGKPALVADIFVPVYLVPEHLLPHSPEQHPSLASPATTTATRNTSLAASHGTMGSMTLTMFDNMLLVSTRFWSFALRCPLTCSCHL
jgi:hypothetical protein